MIPALDANQPFPGLRPYSRADAEWFFGRDEQNYALYRLIDRGRFVAVVGGSGSGKSSIVRAGLLHLLDKETAEEGGRNWHWRIMRPGQSPLDRLAEALCAPDTSDGHDSNLRDSAEFEEIRAALGYSSFGLIDVLAAKLEAAEDAGEMTPLILVDQFEELFRFAELPGPQTRKTRRQEEAAHFVQLLIEASRDPAMSTRIVLTMRSDYLGDCANYSGLPEAVTRSQFLVPGLTRRQLEETVRRPTEKAGSGIDSQLMQRILSDASDTLDQLPVLAHCAMRMWQYWQAKQPNQTKITLECYDAVGTVRGALAQHAEEIIAEPRMAAKIRIIEGVFRALCELDRGRGVRRPLSLGRLIAETGASEEDTRFVVDRLRESTCAFLVPVRQNLTESTVLDIAHEALIRHWARLNTQSAGGPVDAEAEASEHTAIGWLWQEASDGERYRALVTFLKDDPNQASWTLPLSQVEHRMEWWQRRPRTVAWAERYINEPGGDLDAVNEMFERSVRAFEEAKARRVAEEERKEQLKLASTAQFELQKRGETLEIWDAFVACRILASCKPLTSEDTAVLTYDLGYLAEVGGVNAEVATNLLHALDAVGTLFRIEGSDLKFQFDLMRNEAVAWAEAYLASQPFGCFVDLRSREVLEFYGSGYAIGRRFQAILGDRQISRAHMIVFRDWDRDLTEASDLRSMNGTTLNARPLIYGDDQPLTSGDIVVIANIAPFVFVGLEEFNHLAGLDLKSEKVAPFGVPRSRDIGQAAGYVVGPRGLTMIGLSDGIDINEFGNAIGPDGEPAALRVTPSEPGVIEVKLKTSVVSLYKQDEKYKGYDVPADSVFEITSHPHDPRHMQRTRNGLLQVGSSTLHIVPLPAH